LLLGLAAVAVLAAPLPAQVITTVAGGGVNDGNPATAASLLWPRYLAFDAAGNLYISTIDGRIRKVDTAGVITTVVGTGITGHTGDGGPATAATLSFPAGIRFDSAGNLLIADQLNNDIRKVDTAGIITTIAGTGTAGYSGDGGPATQAELNWPVGLALASDDSIYFAEAGSNVVRKIDPSGIITTVAGNGTAGFSGDGGPATTATLRSPRSVLLDGSGNLYIADQSNRRVRKADAVTGIITTVAGNGLSGSSGDGGPATAARIGSPLGLAFDLSGNLLITNGPGARLRRVDLSTGIISTIAGGLWGFNGDGHAALNTAFFWLEDLVLDSLGNTLLADTSNGRIRKIDLSGTVTTIAGGFIGDANPATAASLNLPKDVTVDSLGNIYIADTYNHRVRKVDTSGIITTLAGTGFNGFSGNGGPATAATLFWPQGTAVDSSGNVFIADSLNYVVRKVDIGGTITAFAGDGNNGYTGDGGPATAASLGFPASLSVDALDNLYIVDQDSFVVRKVDTSGTITTVAGDGTYGFGGDGGPATAAQLSLPFGVALDSTGNLYIADLYNNRVRMVDTSGTITTVAGNGTCAFTGDGGPASAASLCFPFDVGVDSAGNLYIVDAGNLRIRSVSPTGVITTLAGNGEYGHAGDGGPAADARFGDPYAVALDALGSIYVADDTFSRIRKITLKTDEDIEGLIALVESFDLQQGISNSLLAKLENALKALEGDTAAQLLEAASAGERQDVANKLEAFISAVEAQRDKEITSAQADELIELAMRILEVL